MCWAAISKRGNQWAARIKTRRIVRIRRCRSSTRAWQARLYWREPRSNGGIPDRAVRRARRPARLGLIGNVVLFDVIDAARASASGSWRPA